MTLKKARSEDKKTKGLRRRGQKDLFHNESAKEFFIYVFRDWLNNPNNRRSIEKFYEEFHSMYLKVAPYHGIDGAIWPKEELLE